MPMRDRHSRVQRVGSGSAQEHPRLGFAPIPRQRTAGQAGRGDGGQPQPGRCGAGTARRLQGALHDRRPGHGAGAAGSPCLRAVFDVPRTPRQPGAARRTRGRAARSLCRGGRTERSEKCLERSADTQRTGRAPGGSAVPRCRPGPRRRGSPPWGGRRNEGQWRKLAGVVAPCHHQLDGVDRTGGDRHQSPAGQTPRQLSWAWGTPRGTGVGRRGTQRRCAVADEQALKRRATGGPIPRLRSGPRAARALGGRWPLLSTRRRQSERAAARRPRGRRVGPQAVGRRR